MLRAGGWTGATRSAPRFSTSSALLWSGAQRYHFHLPHLRGYFLRETHGDAAIDAYVNWIIRAR